MTRTKVVRFYVDTSVFRGIRDDEFKSASTEFFSQVRAGHFTLVTSPLVQQEINLAPAVIQALFKEMIEYGELFDISDDALGLRDSYLKAKILSDKHSDDALHVALATVSQCAAIVSWNFKHIVHFDKIPLYNAVNITNGYHQIAIFSPREVISYEEEV